MESIKVCDFIKLNDPIIIDIRNFYYYSMGHIEGAISIPYYNLFNNYSHYLSKFNKYYMYCDTGEKSLEIVKRLNLFGYDTVSIEGGYDEYVKELNI